MNFSTVLHYFALVFGAFTLIIGVLAALKPEGMSKNFGIAASGQCLPYVITTGIRDVFMSLVIFVLFFTEHWEALGMTCLCLGVVAISDFFIVRKYGNKKASLIHLGGAIGVVGYGVALLFHYYN